MSHFELIGNGCCEMWPIDTNYKYPYRYCTDDKTTPKVCREGRGVREEGERRERGGREEGERRERGGERGGKGEIGIEKKGDDRINGGFLGYGDAFGTATITSDPAWIVNMDHSEIAFNTQVYSLHFHLFPLPSPSLSPPLSPNLLYINRTVLTRCILLALTPKVEYHNS